ncbi:MarR family transcriptional regulator [Spiroplasma litorale]|uniref:MarR family transcriptional regulator n=1 Tax=Spiroplasma litorale TaxID=216942 RepID=A0A0K1W2F3_9MOLU|nr:helix-turn-helix domain-containing protein [Spiroplasma litorale]AKX34514.1 MarR family transcriptional regulator [Spiroplasma litorale]
MSYCPVEISLKVLKNKWTIFIIRELLASEKRFNELKRNLKGVTTKVLAENLKHLENLEIINRKSNNAYPLIVIYSLTDFGHSLKGVLDKLAEWGFNNQNKLNFE